MTIEDFERWHTLKIQLNQAIILPKFHEREIWWCSIGQNIGDELYGKSDRFNRPVLILRKFNRRIFYGVPLSSQMKTNPYYFAIEFKGTPQSVLISQMRLWDARRLTNKMGRLGETTFESIKAALKALI